MNQRLQSDQPSSASGAGSSEEARKRYEREIAALDRTINRYRIDCQRFFAGDLKLPPDELREEIAAKLRRLRSSKLATSADNFRLGSMEARFQSHSELFGRRLRELEEGPRQRPDERPELAHNPREGVILSRDGAVEALYKGLYMTSGRSNTSMDLERFRGHLQKQAEAIRAKTGCREIQFRIAEEDGKMKIKAKPIKTKAGA